MSTDLSAPCDLWVLPHPGSSNWFSHVDWYLNWQMCKGLARPALSLPTQIYRLAEENELEVVLHKTAAESPLLVISRGRIPAGKCVVLEFSKTLKDWLARASQVATDLSAKNVRFFLPIGQSVEQAEKIWKSLDSGVDALFLSDEEALV